jgi:hypothetical protein
MSEHLDEDTLQRYFDRELGAGETTLARRHLTECRSCAHSLRRLERLHALFADASEQGADDAAPELDAMFAAVREGIARQEKAGFGERFRVLVSETFEHKKHVWIPATTIAAAAAVILAVLVTRGGTPAPGPEVVAMGTGQEPIRGSEVLSADFAAGAAGTVFTVEGAEGEAPVVVVWIADEAPEVRP